MGGNTRQGGSGQTYNDDNLMEDLLTEIYGSLKDYSEGRSEDAGFPWGPILYAMLAFVFGVFVLPFFKIVASSFLAVAFRGVAFLIFGQAAMTSIVGSEGYVYYAQRLVRRFVGFGPFMTLFTNPLDAMPQLLNFSSE